jgi:hypothetical protein
MREAMDSILDLCEKGLNDGDYLTVSNNMKELYDSFAKKQRYALIQNVTKETIVSYGTQIKDKVSFILLESEQEILIEHREKKEELRRRQNALYHINTMKTVLASITTEKRLLWTKYNVAKLGKESDTNELFIKHKDCVRREKEYMQKIKVFRLENTLL